MAYSCVDVLGNPLRPHKDLLLHHEHLIHDIRCLHTPSSDPATGLSVAQADIDDVRRRSFSYTDNLQLDGELVLAKTQLIATKAPAIVDVTTHGAGRDPERVRALAKSSDVQMFVGCGRSVERARLGEPIREPEWYRDGIFRDLYEGYAGIRQQLLVIRALFVTPANNLLGAT